jgi:hypothetical protein
VSVLLLVSLISNAQIGGNNTYEFLNLTSSARIASMGGDFLSINDNDLNLTLENPSLIQDEMHNHLTLSFVDYYTDINYGFAAYARSFEKAGNFTASLKYISYGYFDRADETGYRSGQFYSGESAFNLGWGRQLDSLFSIGSNLKFIYSSLESYKSTGLAVDIAGNYHSRDRSFSVSLIAKNIGRQITAYEGGNIEPLPFELQIGLSKKLKHLPFRYSVLFDHLEKWDMQYTNPKNLQVDPISGETVEKSDFEDFADNLMRHFVFGGELVFSKNFSIRAGYNYNRRQQLKVDSKTSTVGFSWGFGFRVSRFHFSYARSTYHLAGSPNYITITTNLSKFYTKGIKSTFVISFSFRNTGNEY